jgi:hypothetical protein
MTIGQMDFWVDQASNVQEPMTPKPCPNVTFSVCRCGAGPPARCPSFCGESGKLLVSPPSVERERLYRKQRKA